MNDTFQMQFFSCGLRSSCITLGYRTTPLHTSCTLPSHTIYIVLVCHSVDHAYHSSYRHFLKHIAPHVPLSLMCKALTLPFSIITSPTIQAITTHMRSHTTSCTNHTNTGIISIHDCCCRGSRFPSRVSWCRRQV